MVVHQDDGILGPAVGALQPAGQLRLRVHHHPGGVQGVLVKMVEMVKARPAAAPPVTQEQEVAIYGVPAVQGGGGGSHEVVVDPPEDVGGEGEEKGEL